MFLSIPPQRSCSSAWARAATAIIEAGDDKPWRMQTVTSPHAPLILGICYLWKLAGRATQTLMLICAI